MSKMRLLLLVLVGSVFLSGMFGLGIYVKKHAKATSTGPGIISPTPFAQTATAKGPTATLSKESGIIQYKLVGSETFENMDTDEVQVPTGTIIKTGENSLAHVIFPNNSLMSLSKNTEVTLDFEEKKIHILQTLGNTWHRVEKVLSGQSYSVETANSLATVRGTEFNVGILDDKGSEVYVMESVVDVSKISKVNGQMEIEETQKVQKDKHIFMKKVDENKPLKVVDMPSDKKNTAWFKRNMKITEEIKQAEEEAQKEASGSAKSMDAIMHQVREKVMENVKEDVEIKKIDQTSAGQVKGVSTLKDTLKDNPSVLNKVNAIDLPTTQATDTIAPTTRPAQSVLQNVPAAVNSNSARVLAPTPTATPIPSSSALTIPNEIIDRNTIIVPTNTPVPTIALQLDTRSQTVPIIHP